ncbi:hypothetical protein QBC39DRAFT_306530 [Podospora conica]|nr:hypothetical protein QBC39DRAFT_306530 [Schizothecium conicum]
MSSPTSQPVALVIGASRGIGRQIALDLARAGYAVVVAAKSYSPSPPSTTAPFPPDPNSPLSTVNTVAREITLAGGVALALPVDTTSQESITRLIDATIAHHSRLDALIYNSGAIWWAPVRATPTKRYQLLQRVNADGLYGAVQAALPHLEASPAGGRIVVVSPPIYSRFFRGKTAYAMGKVAMSVLVVGLGMDFEREGLVGKGVAVTGVWPAVSIESAATEQFVKRDPKFRENLRKATVFSDAVLGILRAPAGVVNGKLELDEDFLRREGGVTDFDKYSVVPGSKPRRIMPVELPDLSVREQDDEGDRFDSSKDRGAKL